MFERWTPRPRGPRGELSLVRVFGLRQSIIPPKQVGWRVATCVYCGFPAAHIDHLTPRSRGGTNDPANLAPACAFCNYQKGSRTEAEFRDDMQRIFKNIRLDALVDCGCAYSHSESFTGCQNSVLTSGDGGQVVS